MQHYSTHLWHIVASPMFRAFCGYEVHRPMGLLLTAANLPVPRRVLQRDALVKSQWRKRICQEVGSTPTFYLLIWNAVVMGKDKKAQPWAVVFFASTLMETTVYDNFIPPKPLILLPGPAESSWRGTVQGLLEFRGVQRKTPKSSLKLTKWH